MIIRINDVRKVNVSIRQIVTTVFLIRGHLRSDFKSSRSMITSLSTVAVNKPIKMLRHKVPHLSHLFKLSLC